MSAARRGHGAESITVLLARARAGDAGAMNRVFEATYDELRRVARRRLAEGPRGSTLEPTALVGAACERLLGAHRLEAQDRRHFFFIMKRAMRDVLVEQARSRGAAKRGGDRRRVGLVDVAFDGRTRTMPIPDLYRALEELERVDPEAAEVVTLRYLGRTLEEAAEMMGCTFAVARRNWEYAKAWLHERLGGVSGPGGDTRKDAPGRSDRGV